MVAPALVSWDPGVNQLALRRWNLKTQLTLNTPSVGDGPSFTSFNFAIISCRNDEQAQSRILDIVRLVVITSSLLAVTAALITATAAFSVSESILLVGIRQLVQLNC